MVYNVIATLPVIVAASLLKLARLGVADVS